MRRSMLTLLLAVAAAIACSDSTGPSTEGAIRVELFITGVDPHSGPITVAIDGGSPLDLSGSGAIIGGLKSGHHTLTLSNGLAPNCAATDNAPRSFAVNPPDTTTVLLRISCRAVTGVVQVRATTTGFDQDLDGYGISLDGGPAQPLLPNGVTRFTGLPGGLHTISVSGLAANCTMPGSSSIELDVVVGGTIRDTASAVLAVACTAVTGALRISAATTGPDADPAYLVRLDATPDLPISKNGTRVMAHLEPGPHTVLLTGIAPNCAASVPNPVTATVTIGDTTDVTFPVTCLAHPTLRVTVSTSGFDLPVNYYVYVDDAGWYYYPSYSASIPANGTASIVVETGDHVVSLVSVPSNCVVTSPNDVAVTLPAGTTVDVAFAVACVPKPTLRVTVSTTGANAPATYLVGVDYDGYYGYDQQFIVPANGSVSFSVRAGNHYVTLDQVPVNCAVTSPNNVTINVPAGATTDLAFAVTCH